MVLETLEFIVAGLGFCAVLGNLLFGIYFIRSSRITGRSVGYNYFGETIAVGVTLFFAVWIGIGNEQPGEWFQLILRFVTFSASLAASIHMARAIDKVIRSDGDI